MALCLYKIEHIDGCFCHPKAGVRKWLKNQRNRWIRKWNKYEVPPVKYRCGWED